MVLPLLLLLLLGSNCKASHFMGTVLTYYPSNTTNDRITVVLRSRTSFHLWSNPTPWLCLFGNCGTEISHQETNIYSESGGDWMQREEISTLLVPGNASFQVWLSSGNWVNNVYNIYNWEATAVVELRQRSDSNKPNSSPVTSILPLLRVPSNCQRDFSLLAFDLDGDDVRCRYGDASLSECYTCIQPPFLSLSSSCTLSFSNTSSSNEGAYVVQMVMEDFPKQNITLTQSDGSQVVKTNNVSISKIPVQFVVSVDPAAPSCTEGLYLPMFLTPTPANGAHLYTLVNQSLTISIKAEALNATISELLYSGPASIIRTTFAPGDYKLTWTPSQSEDGESHPVCFAVQAISASSSAKYHSALRCVVVTVGVATTIFPTTTVSPATVAPSPDPPVVVATRMKMASSIPLSDEAIRVIVIQQVKDELVRRGMPSNVTLRLLNSKENTDHF